MLSKPSNDNACKMLDHPRREQEWYERVRGQLMWRSTESYSKTGGALALAEPVVLRSRFHWVYGAWFEGKWVKVTDGGSWALEHFEPVEWADVTLDDAIMLGQE